MFKPLPEAASETVHITFEGAGIEVPAGINVATALLWAGVADLRRSPVSGEARAPHCLIGVCFECLVEIDGVPARQACLVEVRDGMYVRRQDGAAQIEL